MEIAARELVESWYLARRDEIEAGGSRSDIARQVRASVGAYSGASPVEDRSARPRVKLRVAVKAGARRSHPGLPRGVLRTSRTHALPRGRTCAPRRSGQSGN